MDIWLDMYLNPFFVNFFFLIFFFFVFTYFFIFKRFTLASFDGDMWTMELLLNIIGKVHPHFSYGWVFKDVRDALEKELDFQNEARNAELSNKHFKTLSSSRAIISVPQVKWPLTTKRVLTMEFIDGVKATDLEGLAKLKIPTSVVSKLIIDAFAEQIFITGHVHGDSHPGNILVRRHPQSNVPEVIILDHGLYVTFEDQERLAFCELIRDIVLKDDEAIARDSEALGVKAQDSLLLASMLLQRPYKAAPIGLNTRMTKEDFLLMQQMAVDQGEQIADILKALPRSLLFVFRNLNLVRSINKDLGAPVNRFAIMARVALKGLTIQHSPIAHDLAAAGFYSPQQLARLSLPQQSSSLISTSSPSSTSSKTNVQLVSYLLLSFVSLKSIALTTLNHVVFDFQLQKAAFWTWVSQFYIQTLQFLGRAPKDLGVLNDYIIAA